MWAAMYLCTATPSGGIGAFSGLIIKGFNFNSFEVKLLINYFADDYDLTG